MRFAALAIAAVLCAGASGVRAQTPDDLATTCSKTKNEAMCNQTAGVLRTEVPRAWKGDYQAQRNVSFCLSTGCDGAANVNKTLGCAWRIVIVSSGSDEIDDTDAAALKGQCQNELSATERDAAVKEAETIFQKVYRKPLRFSGFQ